MERQNENVGITDWKEKKPKSSKPEPDKSLKINEIDDDTEMESIGLKTRSNK